MSKSQRVQYTLEFKIEAVRLVRGGQSVGAVSQVLGVERPRRCITGSSARRRGG